MARLALKLMSRFFAGPPPPENLRITEDVQDRITEDSVLREVDDGS